MNKNLLVTLAIALLVAGLLLTTGVVSADVERSNFSGSEICPPAPEGGSMRVEGSRVIIRDAVLICDLVADDPRISGTEVVILDANFDAATFSGQFHAKVTFFNEDGSWTGTVVGRRNPDGSSSTISHGPLHGSDAYAGMLMFYSMQHAADPSAPYIITGYILETGSAK